MTTDWRVPINEILFGLKFTPAMTDEIIRWNADSAVHYESLDLGPGVYHQATAEALASGERLDGRFGACFRGASSIDDGLQEREAVEPREPSVAASIS